MKYFKQVLLCFAGTLLVFYGLLSAFLNLNKIWYSFFVLGGVILFGCINYLVGNQTSLYLWKYKKSKLFKMYVYLIIWTLIIEFVGNYLLELWDYPSFGFINYLLNVIIIGYPFAFLFVFETFNLIGKFIKNFYITFFITFLFCALTHEFPNIFVYEWIYNIDFISISFIHINIIVILGWTILTLVPLWVAENLKLRIPNYHPTSFNV